jgi:hypothetical protein
MSLNLLNSTVASREKSDIRFSQLSVCVDLPNDWGCDIQSREVGLLTQSDLLPRTTSLGLEA